MAVQLPQSVDTVIIGNGPSALILSYILHGHIPRYNGTHQDPVLHGKVSKRNDLLSITPDLYDHFLSSLKYSTQALPINTLLDTLLRPNADTENNPQSCIAWEHCPEKAVSHLVFGSAQHAGGQWAENSVDDVKGIGALSYAEMLSLPGYSYSEHYSAVHKAPIPDFIRPSRAEVSDYYSTYPAAAEISDAVYNESQVANVSQRAGGFYIGSHNIQCRHLVLASGIFSIPIPAPPSLSPLVNLQIEAEPLLVIGSGFSAADAIISASPRRRIIHIFQWSAERSSPLKGCHRQAYPEYAGIYRQMKGAAANCGNPQARPAAFQRRKSNAFLASRDWESVYMGLPNAQILKVTTKDHQVFVEIRLDNGQIIHESVGGLAYYVGRRGTLDYLDNDLRGKVLDRDTDATSSSLVSARSFRSKAEMDLEVAPEVFIIGSLVGDSLVRHAYGGCAYVAGKIMNSENKATPATTNGDQRSTSSRKRTSNDTTIQVNGIAHQDLHLDRRQLATPPDSAS